MAFVALLSGVTSCQRTGSAAIEKRAPLVSQALANLPLRISLPDSAKVIPLVNGVRIQEKTGVRSPRVLSVTRLADHATPLGGKTHRFRSGLVLRYELRLDEAVGSGGDEQTLTGIIEVDGQRFQISCQDQAELWPDAQWCLPWLATLQAAK